MSDGTFLLSLSGQIDYISILAGAGSSWHCKYEFVAGPDWKIVGGLEAGLSQTANVVSNGEDIVLNLPIDIVYKSTNLHGWPQIVLSVYSGINLQGYGRSHIPLQPGLHKLNISLSKPQPSSFLGYLGTFFGYQPELLQPKMLASTAGNNLIQMMSSGEVYVTINNVFQGLNILGYDIGRVN
ncbi:hypothetical protein ILUMI_07050 [Ignelater luminosus]|uniref:B9 domain-containing protein 1 n=1 Tax=Ignelater luminosus TaxID=2038154 RepID=A0A8K0D480_IGNLU|nr:hypothetical protein ILUMI_07050 [Ignelater luminosus]